MKPGFFLAYGNVWWMIGWNTCASQCSADWNCYEIWNNFISVLQKMPPTSKSDTRMKPLRTKTMFFFCACANFCFMLFILFATCRSWILPGHARRIFWTLSKTLSWCQMAMSCQFHHPQAKRFTQICWAKNCPKATDMGNIFVSLTLICILYMSNTK